MLKKFANLCLSLKYKMINALTVINGPCLNIGCGSDVRPFWINCDLQPESSLVMKFDIRLSSDLAWLKEQAFSVINCDHVLGYLTVAQAKNFLAACHKGLSSSGKLIIEFPDLAKISHAVNNLNFNHKNYEADYVELVRAIYAYDHEDAYSIEFSKPTYITGWTVDFLRHCLYEVGFAKVEFSNPQTHDKRIFRDTRVIAFR